MSDQRRTRAGVALLQVVIVVGVAAILGFALLAESSLQAQTGQNARLGAQADALADSGAHLAMYYLLNPANAPVLQDGYWPGGTGISLGATVAGTVDVTLVRDAFTADHYLVTAVGRASGLSGSTVAHQVQTCLHVQPGITINHAVGARQSISTNAYVTITGDVVVNETLTNFGTINGTAYAKVIDNRKIITSPQLITSDRVIAGPVSTSIQTYPTYAYADGRVYSRAMLGVSAIGSGVLDTLNPDPATNPAGIYYYGGKLTLNNNVTVNGTLIVDGDLVINGTNIRITAQDGYPALIVLGDIRTKGSKSMTVDGVCWVAKAIKPDLISSPATSLTFNGALLFGDVGGILTNAGNPIRVNYANPAKLALPDLDKTLARNVTVVSWRH